MNKRLNESSRFMSDTSAKKIAERESVKRFSTAPLNTVSHGQTWKCPCTDTQRQ